MGFPTVRIVSVAFGVLGLTLVTSCCDSPSWILFFYTSSRLLQFGPWKTCTGIIGHKVCTEYGSLPSSASDLHSIRAMTFFSCLLTYFGFLVLLILGFGSNFIPFLQNEETKPKIRLTVGVGLLLAGILLIISLCWFARKIEQISKVTIPGGVSDEVVSGAGFFVGWLAGVLLLLGGGLLCLFRKRNIP